SRCAVRAPNGSSSIMLPNSPCLSLAFAAISNLPVSTMEVTACRQLAQMRAANSLGVFGSGGDVTWVLLCGFNRYLLAFSTSSFKWPRLEKSCRVAAKVVPSLVVSVCKVVGQFVVGCVGNRHEKGDPFVVLVFDLLVSNRFGL